MNNNKLSPDQIISGTESAYIIQKPLTLWDRMYSNKKEQLLIERQSYGLVPDKLIKTLQIKEHYMDLSMRQIILLYRFTNTNWSDHEPIDIIHGSNFFSDER